MLTDIETHSAAKLYVPQVRRLMSLGARSGLYRGLDSICAEVDGWGALMISRRPWLVRSVRLEAHTTPAAGHGKIATLCVPRQSCRDRGRPPLLRLCPCLPGR